MKKAKEAWQLFATKVFGTSELTTVKGNIRVALIAQTFSFGLAIFLALILPKFVSIEEFAYWQLYLLYANYVGIALIGINDGIYLRLGGKESAKLNSAELKTEVLIASGLQSILLVSILTTLMLQTSSPDRLFVLASILLYGIIQNIYSLLSYIFQSVNLTHLHSNSVLVSKVLLLIQVALILNASWLSYKSIIICHVLSQAIALGYLTICSRTILHAKVLRPKLVLSILVYDLKNGSILMIAYYANAMIIGIARVLIDKKFGITQFGLISFAFSLIAFTLTFIGQVSLVLFPALRRLSPIELREQFSRIRGVLVLLMPIILLGFFALSACIYWWLPKYSESVHFLAILMPILHFELRTTVINNTYFKVLNRQRQLLYINILIVVGSTIAALACALWFNSSSLVCLSVLISLVLRCYFSEAYLSKQLQVSIPFKERLSELLLTSIFVACFAFDSMGLEFFIVSVVVFYLLNYRTVLSQIRQGVQLS